MINLNIDNINIFLMILIIFIVFWIFKNFIENFILTNKNRYTKENYNERDFIIIPNYLQENNKNNIKNNENNENKDNIEYTDKVINKQEKEIRKLRNRVVNLIDKLENGTERNEIFYRRKLSNANYSVAPLMNQISNDEFLNLFDDDFSNKTLSTIQFLSQTRPSKFYGSEVQFTSELCDNYCETQDKNAIFNPQVDLVRPIEENKIDHNKDNINTILQSKNATKELDNEKLSHMSK